MTRLHRSNRLSIQTLENRIAPAANISILDAYPVDANNNPITPKAGDQVFIHTDFTTQNLPVDASYAVRLTVDGTAYSPTLTWGAGLSATASWYLYWGSWTVSVGTHFVSVAIDPNQSVAETTYADNATSFDIYAAGVRPQSYSFSIDAAASAQAPGTPNFSFDFGTSGFGSTSALPPLSLSYSAAAAASDGVSSASSDAQSSLSSTIDPQSQSGTITISTSDDSHLHVNNNFARSSTSAQANLSYVFFSATPFTLTLQGTGSRVSNAVQLGVDTISVLQGGPVFVANPTGPFSQPLQLPAGLYTLEVSAESAMSLQIAVEPGTGSSDWTGSAGASLAWSISAAPPPPQITPTLQFDPQNRGIDLGYIVGGSALPQSTTVDLYWASGPNLADVIGGPISGTTMIAPSGTAVGSFYPFHDIPPTSLGFPPAGATFLVAVADGKNVLGTFDSDGNVAAVALRDYIADGIQWDDHRGPGVTDPRRGFDFTFDKNGTDPFPAIEFFWGDANHRPLSSQAVQELTPDEARAQAVLVGGATYVINVPARWGDPPVGARSIIAILDLSRGNGQAALPLHTPDEVMRNSVTPVIRYSGYVMTASFDPGAEIGQSLTLSEAEVVMGVDHFNWVQQVIGLPFGWTSVTLHDVDYNRTSDLRLISGPADGIAFTQGQRGQIQSTVEGVPFFDPIVTPSGRSQSAVTRAFVVNTDSGPIWFLWDNDKPGGIKPYPDDMPYYYNEVDDDASPDWYDLRTHVSARRLEFLDLPEQPVEAILGRGALRFETRLAGVPYPFLDQTAFRVWTGKGWLTNFDWSSNTVAKGLEGSVTGLEPWGARNLDPGLPGPVGGGIFDVRFDDGTLMPGSPTEPPPINLPPLPVVAMPQKIAYGSGVALDASNSTDPDGDRLLYSWTINGHQGAASGVSPDLTWEDVRTLGITAPGSYTVEVTVDDGHGHVVTSMAVALIVDPAVLNVTAPDATKTYGDTIALRGAVSGLIAGDGITYSFASDGALAFAGVAGTPYPITATLNDPDNRIGNYTVTFDLGTVTVDKADQTITWLNPAAITYGTALGTDQLDAVVAGIPGGSAPGALSYSLAAGTVLNAGPHQALTVTAAGTSDYNAATDTVYVDVLKATPTVTVTGGSFPYDEQPHAATGTVVGVGGASLGTPSFTYSYTDDNGTVHTSTTPPTDPGYYTVTASYPGNDDYLPATKTTTITIYYDVRTLTDLSHAFNAGRTIPIKLQLTDAAGNNVSSSSISVWAVALYRVTADQSRTQVSLQDAGGSNPNDLFRYDSSIGGYIFNLSTKGLGAGTYVFDWMAGDDPKTHELGFTLV